MAGIVRARFGGGFLAAALVVLVVAACGSSGSGSPTNGVAGVSQVASSATGSAPATHGGTQPSGGGVPDLCGVWLQSQVDTAGGGSLGAGVPQNDGQMCLWQNQTNASISISYSPPGSGATYDDICSVSDASIVKVDGVGDAACFLVGGVLGTQLVFKKGSATFTVAIQRLDATLDQVEAGEKTLAQYAAAKL